MMAKSAYYWKPLAAGFCFEGLLLLIGEREVPVLGTIAGFLQLPFAFFAVPFGSGSNDHKVKWAFLAFLFLFQGALYGSIALFWAKRSSRAD